MTGDDLDRLCGMPDTTISVERSLRLTQQQLRVAPHLLFIQVARLCRHQLWKTHHAAECHLAILMIPENLTAQETNQDRVTRLWAPESLRTKRRGVMRMDENLYHLRVSHDVTMTCHGLHRLDQAHSVLLPLRWLLRLAQLRWLHHQDQEVQELLQPDLEVARLHVETLLLVVEEASAVTLLPEAEEASAVHRSVAAEVEVHPLDLVVLVAVVVTQDLVEGTLSTKIQPSVLDHRQQDLEARSRKHRHQLSARTAAASALLQPLLSRVLSALPTETMQS